MTYAKVKDGVILNPNVALPDLDVRADGEQVLIKKGTISDQRACGYYLVQDTPAPTIDPDKRLIYSVQFVNGEAVGVWNVRQETPEENTTRLQNGNLVALVDSTTLNEDMILLKAFLTDPDIQVILDQANNTALSTQELNRGLKAIVRQLRRAANYAMRDTRAGLSPFNKTLLNDISDTDVT